MPFSWWTSFTNGRRGTNKQWTNTHHPSSTSTSLLHALCVYTSFLCIHRFFLGLSYYVYLKKLCLTKHHKSDSGMKMSYRKFFPSSLQNMFVVLCFAFWPFQNLSHQKAMTSLLLPMYLLWIKWGSFFLFSFFNRRKYRYIEATQLMSYDSSVIPRLIWTYLRRCGGERRCFNAILKLS